MKILHKLGFILMIIVFGVAVSFATSNLFYKGDNWDAGQPVTKPANDVFNLSGTLSIADSRSGLYINKGYRGDIIGTIESKLFGIFTITSKKLKLYLDVNNSTQKECPIDKYTITGSIVSTFWGAMILDKTSYMCANKYAYLKLFSPYLGNKILYTNKKFNNTNNTINNVFDKQVIAINGILQIKGNLQKGINNTYKNLKNNTVTTQSNLNSKILKSKATQFNQLKVFTSAKVRQKYYISKNIAYIYHNFPNINKTTFQTKLKIPSFTSNREKYFLYDYTGLTTRLTYSGSSYINKGQILQLPGDNLDVPINGLNTVIVKSGNIYIKQNLYNTNSSSLLVVVARRNKKTGNGGNIYIDPKVTNIDAVLISDGSIISLGGTNIQSVGDTNQIKNLRKQLLIYGSLQTSNVIGINKVPYGADYYDNTSFPKNIMANNIFDLGNLRTFNVNYGGGVNTDLNCTANYLLTPMDTGQFAFAGGKSCYIIDNTKPYLRGSKLYNPVIVEYNPTIPFLDTYILGIH